MFLCEKVHISFGGRGVLKGFDYRFPAKGIVAICGANGSGKSTLLKVLVGMLRVRSGRCLFEGTPTQTLSIVQLAQRGVFFLPQAPHLFPDMDVQEIAWLATRHRQWHSASAIGTNDERTATLAAALDAGGLGDAVAKRCGDLSYGERRRLCLVMAALREPRVLLLDEPFDGLDSRARTELASWIIQDVRRSSRLLIFVTHDRDIAESGSDEVIEL